MLDFGCSKTYAGPPIWLCLNDHFGRYCYSKCMKKKLMIFSLALILVAVLLFSFITIKNSQANKRGEEKFQQAISEIKSENPELDNPCLGTHVLRWNSFSELDKKSIEEIKIIAKQAPGDC